MPLSRGSIWGNGYQQTQYTIHNDNNIMMELESEGKGLFDAQNYLMDKIYCLT